MPWARKAAGLARNRASRRHPREEAARPVIGRLRAPSPLSPIPLKLPPDLPTAVAAAAAASDASTAAASAPNKPSMDARVADMWSASASSASCRCANFSYRVLHTALCTSFACAPMAACVRCCADVGRLLPPPPLPPPLSAGAVTGYPPKPRGDAGDLGREEEMASEVTPPAPAACRGVSAGAAAHPRDNDGLWIPSAAVAATAASARSTSTS
eukprot:CAMPEP_0181376174 /NCGR_PEP_ID=MMETSP1106-20121128/17150_1 /TAXON_ID=81844 /ORGANISM="Mantoniella antarctica, Strain SL-175" /LENGTH=212 /DNA_ID=CAMNT_0023494679 /DNA_START=352 /DNA_END=986 /DNA_ORIENTATION=-